jgi:hypothetical protein
MYLKIKKGVCICYALTYGVLVYGQNFKDDMQVVQTELSNVKSFHTEMKISVYQNYQSNQPMLVKQSVIDKKGDSYHYKIDNMEYIKNEHSAILIDNNDKSITLNKTKVDHFIMKQFDVLSLNMDSVLKSVDSVAFISNKNGVSLYRLYTAKNLIIKTDIWIDVNQKSIKKMVYYYDTKKTPSNNKVILEFENTILNPELNAANFDEKKYIKRYKNKYVLKKEFKNYSLSVVK